MPEHLSWYAYILDDGKNILGQCAIVPQAALLFPGLQIVVQCTAIDSGEATQAFLTFDDKLVSAFALNQPKHLKAGEIIDLKLTLEMPLGQSAADFLNEDEDIAYEDAL